MGGNFLDEIVKPEIKQEYEADMENWLATDKYREGMPGLFKTELVSTRDMWLTAKRYRV